MKILLSYFFIAFYFYFSVAPNYTFKSSNNNDQYLSQFLNLPNNLGICQYYNKKNEYIDLSSINWLSLNS